MVVVIILGLKGRYQEIRVARAFFVSIRLNLSKEILSPKERESLSLILSSFARLV